MSKSLLYLLCVSAVADVALFHPEYSVGVVPMLLGFLVFYPLLAVLYVRVQTETIVQIPKHFLTALCLIYLVYTSLQLRFLTALIWPSEIAASVIPVIFIAFAGLFTETNRQKLANLGGIIFGILLLGCFIFAVTNAGNMHTAYLFHAADQCIWTVQLARSMALMLPIPELLFLRFSPNEQPKRNTLFLIAFVYISKIMVCLVGELIFGGSHENSIFQAAKLGELFTLERLEAVQVVIWSLMLYLRIRLIAHVLPMGKQNAEQRVKNVFLWSGLYFLVLNFRFSMESAQRLLAAAFWLVLAVQIIGGTKIWKKRSGDPSL